jgi:hypothetical protein
VAEPPTRASVRRVAADSVARADGSEDGLV